MTPNLVMDGRPQNGAKASRLLVRYQGREIWLSWRCFGLLKKIVEAPGSEYSALTDSEFDRIDEVMYQLRKQLRAQNGPEIESRKVRQFYAEFRVKV